MNFNVRGVERCMQFRVERLLTEEILRSTKRIPTLISVPFVVLNDTTTASRHSYD
jgi:hypothetical protein